MPNRIIRDGVLDSERYHNLPSDSARLLFMELLLLADDYGLVPLGHIFLIRKTTVMAGKTPEAMAQILSSLADQDLLRPFESDGSRFGYIPRFRNYPRAAKPKWPIPEGPSGNEIRELQQKRLASAKHLRTNAPETETETETETEKQKKRDAVASPSRKGSMTTYPVWKAVTIAKGEKLFSDYKPIWDWAKEVGIDELWIDIAFAVLLLLRLQLQLLLLLRQQLLLLVRVMLHVAAYVATVATTAAVAATAAACHMLSQRQRSALSVCPTRGSSCGSSQSFSNWRAMAARRCTACKAGTMQSRCHQHSRNSKTK